MVAPLEGWRVVDLTTVLFGPYATRILADYGAEVLKVEPPSGDLTRWLEPFRSPGMGAMFIAANRGKRSLVLDLKKEEARAILRELVAGADILVHSIRPKAAARLGITFEAMRALKPDLLYCELTGYGQGGPWRDLPAYDDTVQAASGIVALEGEVSDEPHYVPTTLADKVGSLHVVHAILAACLARERDRRARHIRVPMLECLVDFLMVEHLAGRAFEPPVGGPGYARVLAGGRRPYRARDGWVAILPYSTVQWERFLRAIGREDLAAAAWVRDPSARSGRIGELYEVVAAAVAERDVAAWIALAAELDIPAVPVSGLEDLFAHPHLDAVGIFRGFRHPSEGAMREVRFPVEGAGAEAHDPRPAPRLGEDGRAILEALGRDAAAIERLLAAGVTRFP